MEMNAFESILYGLNCFVQRKQELHSTKLVNFELSHFSLFIGLLHTTGTESTIGTAVVVSDTKKLMMCTLCQTSLFN